MQKKINTDEIWLSMQTIRDAYPKYTGEWPISHWCYENPGNLDPDTKIYITDRHGEAWDFFVPKLSEQADWYLHNVHRDKGRKIAFK